MMKHHYYTEEELRFLRESLHLRSFKRITDLFNEHFGLQGKEKLRIKQITEVIKYYKLKKESWASTREKNLIRLPGSPNYRPVGSERINGHGNVEVKTKQPNTWRKKHHVIWEEAHGKIPKGHLIFFADGNNFNFDLDNLLMVPRGIGNSMHHSNLMSADKELNEVGKNIAALKLLTRDRERELKKRGIKVKV